MASIQQFILGLTLKSPDWLLLRLSGKPQRKRGQRRLLPAFQCLCALMEKQITPLEKLSPTEARALWEDAPVDFDPPGRDRPVTREHTVPVNGGQIAVREYAPAAASGPLPALVYYHGGGWVVGSIESHEGLCERLAAISGCLVFSADYRLAPEHPFPVPLADCEAVFEWVAANAAGLGVDPQRIAAGGDSAGGNLTAALCNSRKGAGKSLPSLQLLIYPCTDMNFATASCTECATGPFLTLEAMKWFRGHYLRSQDEWSNPLASPLLAADLSGQPPAIVVTAGFDPLADEGEAYAERLRAAGVPVTHRGYDSLIHGFANMSLIPEARAAVKEIAALLGHGMNRQ
jgi:acetyl esterase